MRPTRLLSIPSVCSELFDVYSYKFILKMNLAAGGWGASDYFSSLAATKASRTKFADEIVAFLNKHNFDGVDL